MTQILGCQVRNPVEDEQLIRTAARYRSWQAGNKGAAGTGGTGDKFGKFGIGGKAGKVTPSMGTGGTVTVGKGSDGT
jgi:hypothetical protein